MLSSSTSSSSSSSSSSMPLRSSADLCFLNGLHPVSSVFDLLHQFSILRFFIIICLHTIQPSVFWSSFQLTSLRITFSKLD